MSVGLVTWRHISRSDRASDEKGSKLNLSWRTNMKSFKAWGFETLKAIALCGGAALCERCEPRVFLQHFSKRWFWRVVSVFKRLETRWVALALVRETLQASSRAAGLGGPIGSLRRFRDRVRVELRRLSSRSSRMKTFFLTSIVGVSALTTSRSRLPVAPARTAPASRIAMEDFGLLKGTQFDFGKEWTKEGASGPGSIEDCLSEATMETYMNKNGLRYKMNKTDKEREGLKLFGGLLPEVRFTVPGINVDVNIVAPQVESIWEALGFAATSNNARRVEEKMKAVAKEKSKKEGEYKTLVDYWSDKYGYTKYYPGSWFYYDQLSTDPEESGRGAIGTPIRKMSGFRMRKGGFYLDNTKDSRK